MRKYLKVILGCFMIAALVMPSITSAKAEENTPGQAGGSDETTEVKKPAITDLVLEASSEDVKINGITSIIVRNSKDYSNPNGYDDFFNFEWKISENLKYNGQDSGDRIRIAGTKLGDATVTVTITDKENAKSTVTISKKLKVIKGSGYISNTKDPLKTEDVIEAMKDSDYINIVINPEVTTEVSKDVFAAAKENGTDLSFVSNRGNGNIVSFSFAASELTNTDIDFNPDFKIGVVNERLNTVVPDGAKPFVIDFAHSGNLPGKATVNISLNEEQAKSYEDVEELYLYHIDNESGKLVYSGIAKVGYKGFSISFEITHCSQYALTTQKLTADQLLLPAAELDDAPNTGV